MDCTHWSALLPWWHLVPKLIWNDIDPSGLSKASEVEGHPTNKKYKVYLYVQTKLQTNKYWSTVHNLTGSLIHHTKLDRIHVTILFFALFFRLKPLHQFPTLISSMLGPCSWSIYAWYSRDTQRSKGWRKLATTSGFGQLMVSIQDVHACQSNSNLIWENGEVIFVDALWSFINYMSISTMLNIRDVQKSPPQLHEIIEVKIQNPRGNIYIAYRISIKISLFHGRAWCNGLFT